MIIAKKPWVLRYCPDLRRQVAAPMRDVKIVQHAAECLAGPVEEGLLLG